MNQLSVILSVAAFFNGAKDLLFKAPQPPYFDALVMNPARSALSLCSASTFR